MTPGEAAGWFAVGALVGGAAVAFCSRLERPVAVAAEPAETPTRVVSEKAHAASKRTARRLNSTRLRCEECGLETTPGPMGGHQRATGHTGRIKV
jgi:hypothetical protein